MDKEGKAKAEKQEKIAKAKVEKWGWGVPKKRG
jgi:hypothetical protein